MNANSQNIGPTSLFGRSNVGHDDHQLDATEPPSSLEFPDDGMWLPAAAAKAADCASEMRRRITEKLLNWESPTMFPGDACLAPPILDRYLGDLPSEVLLSWVHFNPYRPIISSLWYVERPGSNEGLLTFFKSDPFQKQNAVFGLIPGEFNETVIAKAAIALFAANGHESCELFRGLPTSISHAENWRADTAAPFFGSRLAKTLFRFPAVRCWRTTDMQLFCDHLRRFPDPWERATAALEYRDKVAAGAQARQATEFSEPGFDEWFELVTNPVHVDTERQHFGVASEGALRMYQRQQLAREQEGASHNDSK